MRTKVIATALAAAIVGGATGGVAREPTPPPTYEPRVALIGHRSFQVEVVGTLGNRAAERIGLDTDSLLAEVEERLRDGGVGVEPLADDGAHAVLTVKLILAYNDAFDLVTWSAEVLVRQAIQTPENRFLYVTSWSSGGFVGAATLDRAAGGVADSVRRQVDRFLDDFHAAQQ